MDENLRIALDRVRQLTEDLDYYATLTDLLQTDNDELREENRALRGQLALISTDVTYVADVA